MYGHGNADSRNMLCIHQHMYIRGLGLHTQKLWQNLLCHRRSSLSNVWWEKIQLYGQLLLLPDEGHRLQHHHRQHQVWTRPHRGFLHKVHQRGDQWPQSETWPQPSLVCQRQGGQAAAIWSPRCESCHGFFTLYAGDYIYITLWQNREPEARFHFSINSKLNASYVIFCL